MNTIIKTPPTSYTRPSQTNAWSLAALTNKTLVKKDAIESTTFRRVGNARISVPAGTYDTVRIDRIHGDSSRATSFWLAPSLNYLPVKVSQTDDGKTISMSLSSIQ